jgi:hypothetical protein
MSTALAHADTQGGRIFFSGFLLHELSHGHAAPLPLLSHQALMASSPFHDQWRYRQPIPKEFLAAGDAGIERFFDLYNVTAVVAHEPAWRKHFLASPRYRALWHGGSFILFSRDSSAPSYLLSGEGELRTQTIDQVTFTIRSSDAVLKFNYFPFLKSSSCNIEPFAVAEGINFIKLSACPVPAEVTIKAGSAWHRVFRKNS